MIAMKFPIELDNPGSRFGTAAGVRAALSKAPAVDEQREPHLTTREHPQDVLTAPHPSKRKEQWAAASPYGRERLPVGRGAADDALRAEAACGELAQRTSVQPLPEDAVVEAVIGDPLAVG